MILASWLCLHFALRQEMGPKIEPVDREGDRICHFLLVHDIILLEPVEAEDQDRPCFVNFELLDGPHVVLALRTVPSVVFPKFLTFFELLQTIFKRLRILDGLILNFCFHTRVILHLFLLFGLIFLMIQLKIFFDEHDLELEHLVSA